MLTSPCATCKHGHKSKNNPRCRDCGLRIKYLDELDEACECRADPVYQSAYSLPRTFARQLGPVAPFSQMDMILTF
jgi:hypothetical protein